jgi:RNA-directed DNA polymerase
MKSAGVAELPKQAGDVRFRWEWTEPSVWTARMLAALESGVEGGTWFSLIDKVFSLDNLRSSFQLVKRNRGGSGADGVSIAHFESNLEANLQQLSFELKTGVYEPSLIKRCYIPKAGGKELRPLGIPTIRDRVVQGALRNVLEPIFEVEFMADSYGFRPGRGCKDALREVDSLLRTGYRFVVDLDIKSYFDSIPHAPLMDRIREKVSDGRVLQLLEKYLRQGILDGFKEWTPESGTPQGALCKALHKPPYAKKVIMQS